MLRGPSRARARAASGVCVDRLAPPLLRARNPPLCAAGCPASASTTITVATCSSPQCFTKTIGYWQTHGKQLYDFMNTAPVTKFLLWGKEFTGKSIKPDSKCGSTTYDFLWPLCQDGASTCK